MPILRVIKIHFFVLRYINLYFLSMIFIKIVRLFTWRKIYLRMLCQPNCQRSCAALRRADNKKIRFLDQPGRKKYSEGADYGYQWFDKHGDEGFRVFFAYSRRCKKPLITFRISREISGPVLKRYKFNPKGYTSTILVPYMLEGYHYLGIESFKCN